MQLISSQDFKLPAIVGLDAKIDLYTQSQAYSNECLLEAANDMQAVTKWLNLYIDKNTTYNTYRREAMRFLLWCTYEVGKSFTSLKVDDLENYLEFLQNPPPVWCTTRAALRASTAWKPFIGPLKLSAYQCSVRVLNSLFNYLVQADYLRTNPIKLIRSNHKFNIEPEDRKYQVWSRMLEADEWAAILQVLNSMPEKNKEDIDLKIRTQFLFACLYLLGLRIHELVSHNWNAFRQKDGKWWFFVKGKGDKPAHIPVNDQLLEYVKVYRQHLGKDLLPDIQDLGKMIVSKKTGKPYQLRILYNMVKNIGEKAAECFEDNPMKQAKLKKFSPHWLRHLSASHQDKSGISMSMIQENMRHSSSQTTKIYIHAEDEARHEAMQNLGFASVAPVIKTKNLNQKQILKIKLKGMGVNSGKSFARFIESVETNIFTNIKFKARKSINIMIDEFYRADKLREFYCVEYELECLKNDLETQIKHLQREAQFRLLLCSVELP